MITKIGDYFKEKEKNFQLYLDRDLFTIIRMDGMRFHTFTKMFLSPFDPFLHYALELSLHQILDKEMKGYWSMVYFQSDEASIVLVPIQNEKDDFPFKGNILKLTSALLQWNGYFLVNLQNIYRNQLRTINNRSIRPLIQMIDQLYRKKDGKGIDFRSYLKDVNYGVKRIYPSFDCRFIQVKEEDVNKYMGWRRVDCIRNYKNTLGRFFYSSKTLHNINADEVIKKINDEQNIDYREFPTMIKRGNIYRSEKFLECVKDDFYEDDDITRRFKHEVLISKKKRRLDNLFLGSEYLSKVH